MEFEWLFDYSIQVSSVAMYPDYIGKGQRREGKTVTPMGCRAYLSDYRDEISGELVFEGRFNLGAISLNLPMIYMKAKKEKLDYYETLNYYLELIRKLHIKRFEYVGKAKANSNPLMFTQGCRLERSATRRGCNLRRLKPSSTSYGCCLDNNPQCLTPGQSPARGSSPWRGSTRVGSTRRITASRRTSSSGGTTTGAIARTTCISHFISFLSIRVQGRSANQQDGP